MSDSNKTVQVDIDAEDVTKKTERLVEILKEANSLADELADNLKNLQIDIKV